MLLTGVNCMLALGCQPTDVAQGVAALGVCNSTAYACTAAELPLCALPPAAPDACDPAVVRSRSCCQQCFHGRVSAGEQRMSARQGNLLQPLLWPMIISRGNGQAKVCQDVSSCILRCLPASSQCRCACVSKGTACARDAGCTTIEVRAPQNPQIAVPLLGQLADSPIGYSYSLVLRNHPACRWLHIATGIDTTPVSFAVPAAV